MGFSVSGAAAIIFAAMFISFGMFFTATSNGFERVSDAQADQSDRILTQQNTGIEIVSAEWFSGNSTLVVEADNTGATPLEVAEVDLLANNSYVTGTTSVGGVSGTDLWLPEERLRIEVTELTANPNRVKLVSGPGVADTAEVV